MTKRQTKICEYVVVALIIALIVALLGPASVSDLEPYRRRACQNRLQLLGQALENYHAAYGVFPPAYLADKDGQPMHSWRVLLLPFLGQQAIYDAYRFDEPWNGPNNAQLPERFSGELQQVFSCPSERTDKARTSSYLAIVGPHAPWAGRPSCQKTADFPDGLERTLLFVEVHNSGIGWFEPRDLEIERMCFGINDPSHCGIRSSHRTNTYWTYAILSQFAYVMYADGRVAELSDTTPPRTVHALLTRDGGENVSRP